MSEPSDPATVASLEAALRASEARFRALVSALPDIVVRTSTDGFVRDVQSADPGYLGVPFDEVVGRHITEPTGTGFGGDWLERTRRVASTGQAETWEFHTNPVGAPRRYFEGRMVAAGPTETVTTVRNISDTVVQRQRLVESETRYRSLFERTAAAALLLDLDGRILAANPTAVAAGGYSESELTAMNVEEFLPREDIPGHRLGMQLIASGQTLDFEQDTIHKDGRLVHWRVSGGPITVADQIVGVFATAVNITEQKRALEALSASEERFRLVQNATRDVICEWDYRELTLQCSPNMESVFGHPSGLIENGFQWWEERVHPDDFDRVGTAYNDAHERGEAVYRAEYRFRRGDGQWAVVLETGIGVLNEAGKPLRLVASLSDITAEREAQAALVRSEERYRLVQRATNDVVWENDHRRDEVVVSDSLQNLLGYPGGTYASSSAWWLDIVHPDDLERQQPMFDDALAGPSEFVRTEYRLRRSDGSYATVVATVVLIRDDSGEVVRSVGSWSDVTERRAAEQALAAEKRLLETVLEQMPVGVLIAEAPSGKPVVRNRALLEMMGSPRSSESWRDYGNLRGTRPDGTPLASEEYPVARALLNGVVVPAEEMLYTRSDGTVLRLQSAAAPVWDNDGAVLAVVAVFSDATELAIREAWLKALAATVPAFTSDLPTVVTLEKMARSVLPDVADYCNVRVIKPDGHPSLLLTAHSDPTREAEMRRLREAMGETGFLMQHPQSVLESGKPAIVHRLAPGWDQNPDLNPELVELIRKTALDSYIIVPMRSHGRLLGTVTFSMAESGRHLTDLDVPYAQRFAESVGLALDNAQLYDALRQSDEAKDRFLAVLGHELRNPIAGIRNSLELLRVQQSPDPSPSHALDALDRQVRVMVRLVDDLLDLARISQGRIELRKETVELGEVLADALQAVRPLLEAKQLQLEARFAEPPLWVHADPVRLAQVYANILDNAAKYTPEGGHIVISALADGGDAVVTITDDGLGIPSEFLPRLFDYFAQADNTSGRSRGGLGIGLPLANSLVIQHGGSLEAGSEGPGHGSVFTIRLPLVYPMGPRDDQAAIVREPTATRTRVLVVDDNVDAAESLRGVLRAWGFDVPSVATTGAEAVSSCRAMEPHLVLLDIALPDMDGYEVARQLRGEGYAGSIIAMTGYGQASDRERSASAGIDRHLVKPVDFGVLEDILRQTGR